MKPNSTKGSWKGFCTCSSPASLLAGPGSQDVVVGCDVGKAQSFNRLSIILDGGRSLLNSMVDIRRRYAYKIPPDYYPSPVRIKGLSGLRPPKPPCTPNNWKATCGVDYRRIIGERHHDTIFQPDMIWDASEKPGINTTPLQALSSGGRKKRPRFFRHRGDLGGPPPWRVGAIGGESRKATQARHDGGRL
jgi:hypothetical protein